MKKIIWAILISAALAFGFASCDDGATGGGRGWDAVGTWKCVRTTYGNGSVSYDERYEFKQNETYEYTFNGKLERSGTWRYNETGIELTTGFGLGPGYRKYNSATKEFEHEMIDQIRFYAKQ